MKSCLLLSSLMLAFAAFAEVKPVPTPRTALLMGAWNYSDPTFPTLPQAGIERDLNTMKSALEGLGFTVTVVANPSLSQAEKAVDTFGATVKLRGGASLFYFTGHGAEHDGKNYLIPTGTAVSEAADLKDEALAANRILARMESAGTKVNLLFLDCCRNSLTKAGGDTGLAPMTARGSLIGFATRSGDVAATTIRGSPYTQALVARLATPGISLPDMHTLVTEDMESSAQKQRPGSYVDLGGIFQMIPGSGTAATAPRTNQPPTGTSKSEARPGAMQPGTVLKATLPGGVAMLLCYCPAGEFTMGSPASEEFHSEVEKQEQVTLTQPFLMGRTEVTQRQWKAVMGTTPSQQMAKPPASNTYGKVSELGPEQPMYLVNADEADAFVKTLNVQAPLQGWRWALPSEAQWEYACRAGTRTPFSFGSVLNGNQANCDGNFPYGTTTKGRVLGKLSEVGRYAANDWGLCDMHGNVWEWCADSWDGTAKLLGGADPRSTSGMFRVIRGGSFDYKAQDCRSGFRRGLIPPLRSDGVGFRVVTVPAN